MGKNKKKGKAAESNDPEAIKVSKRYLFTIVNLTMPTRITLLMYMVFQ